MTDLVSADKVFDALFAGGYVKPFVWKDINKQTTKYPVAFICDKCNLNAFHIFEVVVRGGEHYISARAVSLFCEKHGVKI